ncbi:MAG: alpha-amylase family glycosyl hydrolase [Acidimicrobiaceae bacterium]|nr:alpha-amylase family glycosyl hydrolase [Acidimicrobiaceae bacterium]
MTSSAPERATVGPGPAEPWWRGAVGYEIYVRSFADSDGDGVGDLAGITGRLDHLSWLGVDAVWLTPFYPSPGHDHGYDVSDYRAVSPRHGTLDDFDVLVEEAHRRGLRVMVDIVPNHTSIEHEWFARARRCPDGPDRDRYLWADPASGGGPPNNWRSHFGGPAWTLDEASGQYWCHLFLPEQPDLNWRNPAVRDDFDSILEWWMDRGVDGFRVDVAHGLVKDARLRDNPQIAPLTDGMDPFDAFNAFEHRHDMDQSENVEVFRRWNRVCAPREAMLLGEVNAPWPDRQSRYVEPGALDQAFFLQAAFLGWAPETLLTMVRAMHDAAPQGVSWVLSNHDRSRPVSRFGGGETGVRRSLAVSTLFMALGGTPFLFQGEELALPDGVLSAGFHDPVSVRNAGATSGRDGCRTPMPWDSGANNGFSTGDPWIDSEPRPPEQTVAGQQADPDAPVYRYRSLLALRRQHPDMWRAPLEWIDTADPGVAALRRGTITVVANLSERRTSVSLGSPGWQPVFASQPGSRLDTPAHDTVSVPPETTVVLAGDHLQP